MTNTKLCKYFSQTNSCKKGADCKFSHQPLATEKSDPRLNRNGRNQQMKKKPKNTITFTPFDREVDLRIVVDTSLDKMKIKLHKNDVGLFTNIFSDFQPWELHDLVLKEIQNTSIDTSKLLKYWHGNDKIKGTHLICDDSTQWKREAPTFNMIIERLSKYFGVTPQATRCNWYNSHKQHKPLHHDAAAFDEKKAAKQNITIALSLGQSREILLQKTKTSSDKETNGHKGVFLSFPAPDCSVYAFTNEVNVSWKHGVHVGVQEEKIDQESRISIIIWGWMSGIQSSWC